MGLKISNGQSITYNQSYLPTGASWSFMARFNYQPIPPAFNAFSTVLNFWNGTSFTNAVTLQLIRTSTQIGYNMGYNGTSQVSFISSAPTDSVRGTTIIGSWNHT